MVGIVCQKCGHVAEVPALSLRERLPRDEFVKHIGVRFRCQRCGHKGADIDARGALGILADGQSRSTPARPD